MMKLVVSESFTELLTVIGSAIGSLILTFVGTITEQAAFQNLVTGHLVLGVWEAWMGTLALIIGIYLFGYREFWPRLQNLRHTR